MQGKVANGLFAIKTGIFGDLLGSNASLAEQRNGNLLTLNYSQCQNSPQNPP